MACALGHRFSADELAELTEPAPAAVLAALREALAAGLVTEDDRMAFRHDLVREAADAIWRTLISIAGGRLDEAFALIDAGMRTAQQDGTSVNIHVWSMMRFRVQFCSGHLAARADAEATIEMTDEIGDGNYGYINHAARYILAGWPSIPGTRPGFGGSRSAAGWPELTESEFMVVSLVVQGATNREVAERLSAPQRHLLRELGARASASSRAQPGPGIPHFSRSSGVRAGARVAQGAIPG